MILEHECKMIMLFITLPLCIIDVLLLFISNFSSISMEQMLMIVFFYFQYKNAFFSANPDFKWYKLPAPPLRTLNTRPNFIKIPQTKKQIDTPTSDDVPMNETLFNPGKLADETQLGSITSLINNDNNKNIIYNNKTPSTTVADIETDKNEDITFESSDKIDNQNLSPLNNFINITQPPKPFKKRMIHQNKDTKNVVRCIFTEDESTEDQDDLLQDLTGMDVENDDEITNNNIDSNVTKQELIDKVVDHICSSKDGSETNCITCSDNKQDKKEQRTSVRSCKGLRYAKFMAEGKLLVNKRNKKHNYSTIKINKKTDEHNYNNQVPRHIPIELNETIKKLAERTAKTVTYDEYDDTHQHSEDHIKKMFRAADFNLDAKIEALPSLSFEKFQQKKKENKKKKIFRNTKDMIRTKHNDSNDKSININNNILTGSRKRKPRKQSITRLDPQDNNNRTTPEQPQKETDDLFGLETLAEVAAKKAKIDQ